MSVLDRPRASRLNGFKNANPYLRPFRLLCMRMSIRAVAEQYPKFALRN